jgi:hypothetical protein
MPRKIELAVTIVKLLGLIAVIVGLCYFALFLVDCHGNASRSLNPDQLSAAVDRLEREIDTSSALAQELSDSFDRPDEKSRLPIEAVNQSLQPTQKAEVPLCPCP